MTVVIVVTVENVCLSNLPFPLLFPKSCVCLCECVWVGRWAGGLMCKRVSVYVSEWVCVFAVPIYFHFFTLAFVLVNDLCLVSRCFCFVLEMRTILFSFLLPFVSFCCKHLYFLFPSVSYQMFFHWCSFMYPHCGFWNKPLDLTWLVYNELRLTGTIFKKSPAKPVLSL